jgi:PAS domain S-box-containing protein
MEMLAQEFTVADVREGMLLYTLEGRVSYVNAALRDRLEDAQIVDKEIFSLDSPYFKHLPEELLNKALQGESFQLVYALQLRSNELPVFKNYRITPLFNVDGTVTGGAVFVQLTSNKSVISLQQVLTNRFIFDFFEVPFACFSHTWQCYYINPAGAAQFNQTPSYFIGKNFLETFKGAISAELERAFQESFRQKKAFTLEDYYPPQDKWFLKQFIPLKDGVAFFFTDITEKKAKEQANYIALTDTKNTSSFQGEILATVLDLLYTSPTEMLPKITKALKSICRYSKHDKGLLVLSCDKSEQLKFITDSSAELTQFDSELHQNYLPWLYNKLVEEPVLYLPDKEALPAIAQTEIELLQKAADSHYLTVVPIVTSGEICGFIAVGTKHPREETCSDAIIGLLQISAAVIGNMLILNKKQHNLEKALQRYEFYSRYIYEVITLQDESLKYLFATPSVTKCLGYQPNDFVGKVTTDLLHPDDRKKMSADIYNQLRKSINSGGGAATTLPYRMRHSEGHYIWVESQIQLLQQNNMEVLLSVTRDVSRRIQEEDKAQVAQQLFTELFESNIDALFLIDAETKAIALCNAAATQLFGYSKEELIGLNDYDLQKSPTRHEEALHYRKLIDSSKVVIRTTTYLTKQGTSFIANYRAQRIGLNDESIILVNISDITQDREREEQIESLLNRTLDLNTKLNIQNQKLNQVNEELDKFVYSVSHDFRAPISTSLGLLNLLRLNDSSMNMTEFIELQEENLNKLDKLIQNVLNYAQYNRLNVECNSIMPGPIVKEVWSNLELTHPIINSIDFSVKEKQPLKPLFSDYQRTFTLLKIVLSNAMIFRKKNTDKHKVNVLIDNNQEGVNFIISDNGRGISPEHQASIFQMFFKAHENQHGSGLGLYIGKQLIQRLNGLITVESEADKGATFTIYIPHCCTEEQYKLNNPPG